MAKKTEMESTPIYRKGWFMGLAAVVLVLVLLALWTVSMYNGFVTLKVGADNAWANVEVQYQRRVDLIPNLVETTKGYANYEQSTLTQITELRSQWAAARQSGDVNAQVQTANQLEGVISKLLFVAEAYPDLKASQNFLALQDELAGTENRVAVSRKDYNDAVRKYNTAIKTFPGVMFAGMFGFGELPYFEAQAGSENAPAVSFEF